MFLGQKCINYVDSYEKEKLHEQKVYIGVMN